MQAEGDEQKVTTGDGRDDVESGHIEGEDREDWGLWGLGEWRNDWIGGLGK